MEFYGLKTCDTCRKARKALSAQDMAYVDVRAVGLPMAVLKQAFDQFGGALLNRSSTTWRGLSDDQKAGDPLELLQQNPTLMKRPLIVNGAEMTLGWGKDVQAQYGLT